MDLVDGLTVLEVIERRGFLPNEEALSITLQAARGLKYLHENEFIHRDIKPGNLMVEPSGLVRMIDLGLIHELGTYKQPGKTEEITTVGTVEYLSPEQARGRVDIDPRADIYSLGVTLYHMVVGEVPFLGESEYEIMAKQVLASLDTQKVKQRRVAPEVHFFITKMTSKERENRFETIDDVIAAMAGYVRGMVPVDLGQPRAAVPVEPPVAAPAPPPVAKPVQPPPTAKPVRPPKAAPKPAPPPAPKAAPKVAPKPAPKAAPRRAAGKPAPEAPKRSKGMAPKRAADKPAPEAPKRSKGIAPKRAPRRRRR